MNPVTGSSNKAPETVSDGIIVAALYKFVRLPDYRELRGPLLELCRARRIKGTILLAGEGINGTVAGDRAGIDALLDYLHANARLADLEHKEAIADGMPFYRMKVKLKKEIVTLGVPDIDPSRVSGMRVDPQRWNELIKDPDVLVIDTRNSYEYRIGTFTNAVSPETDAFSEFPDYVKQHLDSRRHKKIAMFCTGGIRCEKASAYLLEQGFAEVYQLQGGILKYLEEVEPGQNQWQGECFVFDGRVAVNEQLHPGVYELCYSCRMPVSPKDRASEKFEQGVSCPRCHDTQTEARRTRLRERQRQVELAASRNYQHIGAVLSVSKKSE
jgi:UPF0176 protein